MEALKWLAWSHDRITDIGFHLSKLCLGIIVFSYCYEVVARYFFANPTWWADEAVSYALCIGIFLMMPEVTRQKGHVAVTLLLEVLPPRPARNLTWFIYLLCFLACAAATWISIDENIRQIVKDVKLIRVEPLPKWWISVWISYGFLSSTIYFLRFLDYRKIPLGERGGTAGKVG